MFGSDVKYNAFQYNDKENERLTEDIAVFGVLVFIREMSKKGLYYEDGKK